MRRTLFAGIGVVAAVAALAIVPAISSGGPGKLVGKDTGKGNSPLAVATAEVKNPGKLSTVITAKPGDKKIQWGYTTDCVKGDETSEWPPPGSFEDQPRTPGPQEAEDRRPQNADYCIVAGERQARLQSGKKRHREDLHQVAVRPSGRAPMRVLAVEHQSDAGLGVFAEALADDGHELTIWEPALGGPPPDGDHDAMIVLGGAVNVEQQDGNPWIGASCDDRGPGRRRLSAARRSASASQLLTAATGGSVAAVVRAGDRLVRRRRERRGAEDPLLGPLAPGFEAFQWH